MSGHARAVWVAVAESGEVGRHLLACNAGDRPLVLFRRENGDPAALDDECWHRMLPLSNGRLEGDQLICAYHGLAFDPEGRCVRARLGPPPRNACVQAYPAVEAHGMVWVRIEMTEMPENGGSIGLGSVRSALPPQ